jgi:hypothetical protein
MRVNNKDDTIKYLTFWQPVQPPVLTPTGRVKKNQQSTLRSAKTTLTPDTRRDLRLKHIRSRSALTTVTPLETVENFKL